MRDVFDWLGENEWSLWTAFGMIMVIVETTTLDLIFLMIAGGAIAGAVAALAGLPVLGQALIAIAATVALLGVVRPIAKRHMHQPSAGRTGVAALIGRRAVVLARVDGAGGQVKLAGEVWTARSYDGSTIDVGASVDVVEIQGATALVFSAEEP
jgi:membrane protein implicated in regulation of membrane protease activity